MGKKVMYKAELKNEIFLGTLYDLNVEDRKIFVLADSASFSEALENIALANNARITIEGNPNPVNYQEFKELIDSCYAIFRKSGNVLDFL